MCLEPSNRLVTSAAISVLRCRYWLRPWEVGVVGGDRDSLGDTNVRPIPQREVGTLGGDDLQSLVPRLLIGRDRCGLQSPPHLVVRRRRRP